jgi:hypothetical protein
MSLGELIKLISPPPIPTDGGVHDGVTKLESQVGSKLPSDYLEFGIVYGSGRIYDEFIRVMNPFDPSYLKWRSGSLRRLTIEKQNGRLKHYDIFPAYDGLLPWGEDENGTSLTWKTSGDPDHWPVVVVGHNGCVEEWPLSFSSFLARVFTNQIQSQVWHESFVETRFDFTPY